MALIKDEINNKSKNAWFEKLTNMVKYIETPTLYKHIKNGTWQDNWAIPVFKDAGNGKPDLGFGNQSASSKYPVRMAKATFKFEKGFPESRIMKTATIHEAALGKDRMAKSGAFASNEVCVAYKTSSGTVVRAIEQVSLLADFTIYDYADTLYKSIANNSETASWLDTMTDNELCAIVDVWYNLGPSWVKKETLKTLVGVHQKAKKGGIQSEIDTALANVKDAFMLYAGASGVSDNTNLKIRRTKDANMYGGGSGIPYDSDDNYNTWKDIMNKNYKDIPASALITITLDEAVKQEAAYSSINAMVGKGYSTKLYAMIGSNASMTEIEKAIKAEDEAAKKKEAQNASKVNSKGIEASKQALINDDINNLEYLADMRTLSGLTVPAKSDYSRENGMSDTDRSRANMTHNYGMFKKYKHTNDEDLGQAKTTWFFLTRPDMCLYQNTNTNSRRSNVNFRRPSLQCQDQDLIDHLIIDRDLYIYLDRNVAPEHTDTNVCFIPAFTNQFKTANLPEARFEMAKSSANINGVAVNIPTYNSSDTADTEIPVTFNVDNEMSIVKYTDIIFKYAKSVKEGLTIPYKESVKYNVIDFSMTMFAFVVAQDGVTLESMYRSVGVVPSTNPVSSIPLSSNPEKMDGVTISFKTNTNLDSRKMSTITHFNMLNRYGCTYLTLSKPMGKISTYDDAIDWYCLNYNVIEAYIQDNMTAEDWYCERFIIYLDTNSKQENGAVYKLIGIPPLKRLEQILDFLLNKSYNTLYNTLIIHETAGNNVKEYKMRPGIKSIYYKRIPDISAIKSETKKFVDDMESTTEFYKGWQAMARQADLDMRGDSEFYRNPGTGIRVLSNSKDRATDGTMVFNLFKTIQDDLPSRNNMYDLFLTNDGKIRDVPTWMSNFYNFLNSNLLNQDSGKITNVITYAITGELTYSLDDKTVDPLESNLGAKGVSDKNNTVYKKYSKGVKRGLSYYTRKDDGSYGIVHHKFNTIDRIADLGLFVDGLYIPEMNDASVDIYNQIEKKMNSAAMVELKNEEFDMRYYIDRLNTLSDLAKDMQKADSTVVKLFNTSGLFSYGIKGQTITKADYKESTMIKKDYFKDIIGKGFNFYNNNIDKNPHHLLSYVEMYFPNESKLDRLLSDTWNLAMKSSKSDFNNMLITPNPFKSYLSIQPDKTTPWKENSGVAPYFIIENEKLKVYNTKAVFVDKDFQNDKINGNNPSTKDITKIATINDKSNIVQEEYLKMNSNNRYSLLSFMNSNVFQKQFTIADWMSFYMPQATTTSGSIGSMDKITNSSGEEILKKYHDIMFVSEWTKSSPVKYNGEGMQIHYMVGDIPESMLSGYNDFMQYYDVTLDDMSDGTPLEIKNKATGDYDRTDKAKKLFYYYPDDVDIIPKEVREKNSWITKEGWENRLKTWWGNAKTAALETLWDQSIALATKTLENTVRKLSGDAEEDRKDGKHVSNPLSENSSSHKEYIRVLERSERGINKPRALYFKDPSVNTIKTGLPEIQSESVIKPIPAEYYRSNIKLITPEVQNNIAKVTSEELTSSKILKLLKDL